MHEDEEEIRAMFEEARAEVDASIPPWVGIAMVVLQVRSALMAGGANDALASYLASVFSATYLQQAQGTDNDA